MNYKKDRLYQFESVRQQWRNSYIRQCALDCYIETAGSFDGWHTSTFCDKAWEWFKEAKYPNEELAFKILDRIDDNKFIETRQEILGY